MLSPEHRKAQELSARASLAAKRGAWAEAQELYAKAATLEQVALDDVDAGAVRTKGIFAVSLAALLYKAKEFEAAETAIFRVLGQGDLLPHAKNQLRELLDVVGDEKLVYSGHGVAKRSGLRPDKSP